MLIRLIAILSYLFFMMVGVLSQSGQEKERPNVIIILTDDQGSIDLNCFGAEDLHTPELDKLAESGIRFYQFYVGAPVCSPSRASLLTGLTPQSAGLPGNTSSQPGHSGMPSDRYTMAEMMHDAGYATAHIGKWHLGFTPETMPLGQGFDYSFGHMGGCIDNYSHFFYWNGPNRHDLYENGKEVWADGCYFPDLMTEKATGFIRENKDNPFFMYYALNLPHYPVQPDKKWREHYAGMEDQRRANYGAFVSTLDERVGRLIKELEEHNLRDNTLIIFMADHGHSNEVRNFGGGGNAGPYRGSKFSLFEGGIRVPAIISWPKKISADQKRYQWVMSLDMMPTIAELCGISLPVKTEGESVVSILNDEYAAAVHHGHIWQSGAQWAVRKDNWKLIGNPIDQSGKGTLDQKSDQLFLINLDEDRTELMNFAALVPEKVEELTNMYLQWGFAEPTLVPGNRSELKHQGQSSKVTLLEKPASQYASGAAEKIIDGITGTTSFSDGNWLGYYGNDLEVVFDLEKNIDLKKINIGCLEDHQSHIFLPTKIEVWISEDGERFGLVKEKSLEYKASVKKTIIRPQFTFKGVKARYIKMKVHAIHKCPASHNAEGETAWLFVDEISID